MKLKKTSFQRIGFLKKKLKSILSVLTDEQTVILNFKLYNNFNACE